MLHLGCWVSLSYFTQTLTLIIPTSLLGERWINATLAISKVIYLLIILQNINNRCYVISQRCTRQKSKFKQLSDITKPISSSFFKKHSEMSPQQWIPLGIRNASSRYLYTRRDSPTTRNWIRNGCNDEDNCKKYVIKFFCSTIADNLVERW